MPYQVLGVTRYNMTDKDTGEVIKGAKVFYLPDHAEEAPDRRGFLPVEISAPYEVFDQVKTFPVSAELEFSMKQQNVNGRRKVVATCTAVRPVAASK